MRSKMNWTEDLAFTSFTKPFLRAKSHVVESASRAVVAFCVRRGIAHILSMFLVVFGCLFHILSKILSEEQNEMNKHAFVKVEGESGAVASNGSRADTVHLIHNNSACDCIDQLAKWKRNL